MVLMRVFCDVARQVEVGSALTDISTMNNGVPEEDT
jgi:hypothetical protein